MTLWGLTSVPQSAGVNVARRLTHWAATRPEQVAVAAPWRGARYQTLTFRELDEHSTALARGLVRWGVPPGARLVLLVPPGIEFVALVFALLKAGVVMVLIDPGMGRRHLIRCLAEVEPEGFVAVPRAQWVRAVLARKFPRARWNVAAGRLAPPGCLGLAGLGRLGDVQGPPLARGVPHGARADEPAAVLFTTGSTGPPKGVLYTHGIFDTQVQELQAAYQIQPGEIDLPGFPLFGLFNSALGVTSVIPEMDPTRPARVDPRKIVAAVQRWQVTQSFGSPALWQRVGTYCRARGERMPTLRRVLSAGAAVPARVLEAVGQCIAAEGQVHTPYGATEALPVATISAREVLETTSRLSRQGAGVCVGRRFPGIAWKVIEAEERPLPSLDDARELPRGEIGELIVSGAVVTREYVTRRAANAWAKIADGQVVWHRMGDVGYLDDEERFWYCGRMAHRVRTAERTLYTECCEAIFQEHPAVFRAALVGVGVAGAQRPAIVVEPWPERRPRGRGARARLVAELAELARAQPLTEGIRDFLLCRAMPVDIRHNAKIFREQLAAWAERQLPP